MTASPRRTAPRLDLGRVRALLANRYVAVGGAAVLLAGAVTALVLVLGHGGPGASAHLSLSNAPKAWRQALHPRSGPLVSQDVVRLSETALAPQTGAAWSQPTAPAAAPMPVAGPLPAAPIPGLFTQGPSGPLPIIGTDGRTPFSAYRRPFLPNGRPRVALVLGGLGLNPKATQTAIDTLPADITLGFSPYADNLQDWINKARAHGHEVLLEAPMEPVDYPDNDPGPYTLMAGADGLETVKKFEWILSRAAGYFGVINQLGSRFLGSDTAYGALATAVKGRGLAFVDDGTAAGKAGAGVLRASAERAIDTQPAPDAIDQQLLALESSAEQRGQALAVARAYPVSLETVARWAQSLEGRGFQLAPVSALVH